MSTDRTPDPGSDAGKPAPEGRHRTAREIYRELDGPADEHFKQSLAGFARRVGERVAQQKSADPQAAAMARRAALQEYDLERSRRLKTALAAGGGTTLALGIASFVVFIASPEAPSPAASSAANADRTTVVEVAAGKPVPVPAPPPPPLVTEPTPPVVLAIPAERLPAIEALAEAAKADVTPAADPLHRDEIREVQKLLRAFGFNAGPVDGAAGPVTQAAAMRYQQERGLPQTGDIDRELLAQLRDDPSPKVATPPQVVRRAHPTRTYHASSAPPRSSNPFENMRRDFIRFQRWLRQL